MFEELGINTPLTEMAYFRMPYGHNDFMINKLFSTCYDGEFRQNNETIKIFFLDIQQLFNMIDSERDLFTPWAIELLSYYFGKPNKLIPIAQKYGT
jgi:hypothetical protein